MRRIDIAIHDEAGSGRDADETRTLMAEAFNEWMRRYIEEPERFSREFEDIIAFLAEEDGAIEPSYGRHCAAHLVQLMAELAAPTATEADGAAIQEGERAI